MSFGGTSNVAPIVGAGTPAANRRVTTTPQPAVAAPSTGGNRNVATGYVPTTGVESGAATGGGELATGIARSTAMVAPRAASAAAAQPQLAATRQQAATTNAASVAAAGAPAPAVAAGPAAWSDEWDAKFVAAGIDASTMDQLRITGGMGLDAAQLEQALQQTATESDALVEQLRATHGHEVAKLEEIGTSKSEIAIMAQQVASGEMSEADLVNAVDGAYGMTGPGMKRMLMGDMLPYGIVPGWGLVSGAIGLGNGVVQGDLSKSTNPFSDRRLFGTKMDAAFTPLMAGGGAVTLYAIHQEQQRIKAGRAAIATDPALSKLGPAQQLATKPGNAFNPYSLKNKQIAGYARFAEFERGVKHLESVAAKKVAQGAKPSEVGAQATVARNVLEAWRSGRIDVASDPVMGVMKWMPMGAFNKSRGSLPGIGNRSKLLAEAAMVKHRPTIKLDVRLQGPALTAHLTAAGEKLIDGQARHELLSRHSDPKLPANIDRSKRLRDLLMANSTKDLMESTRDSAARLQQPTKLRLAAGKLRPGAVDDAFKAVRKLDLNQAGFSGPMGLTTKFGHLPTGSKIAVGAAGAVAAVGIGYAGLVGLGKLMGGEAAAPAEGAAGTSAAAPTEAEQQPG